MLDEPKSEIDWRVVHTLQLGCTGFIVFLMVVIWAATGLGEYFWPIWVWFGLVDPARGAVRDPTGAATGHGDGGRCRSTPRCRASPA